MLDAAPRRAHRILAVATLVAAVAIVYRPALSAYFFDDDFQWLTSPWSFHVADLVDFASMTHFYRPIINVYFAVATPLFGGSPVLFHLANVIVHAANGLLVFVLAQGLAGSVAFGFLTALFFVVQPADIEAVAWVGALAEPVGAFFGLLSLVSLLRFRSTGGVRWHVMSMATFLLALLTHESSIMFLPLLVLMARMVWRGTWSDTARRFVGYGLIAAVYLAIDLWINSRNYVVSGGSYRIGWHAVTNTLDYIVALYVGRRDATNYVFVAVTALVLLLRGNPRVRYATCWVLLGLAPFVFFTWSNTSRYLYLPAIGFAMLLAEGVMYLDRVLVPRLPRRGRAVAVGVVAAAIAIRFIVFAVENVTSFALRTEKYRQYGLLFRQLHGPLPPYSRVQPDPRLATDLAPEFVSPMIQWQYDDPTIELIAPGR